MKTAISIPDDVFADAEQLARAEEVAQPPVRRRRA
jgi:hypothetical protein